MRVRGLGVAAAAVGAESQPPSGSGSARKRAPCGTEGPQEHAPARSRTPFLASPKTFPRSNSTLMHVGWQSKPPAGPHLRHMRGREGRLWCGRAGPRAARAAGVLCGAGIAIPCASPRLSEPVFWVPRQIAFARPLPPGLAARAGRARAYAGQRGAYMMWCVPACGRRARRGALQGQGTAVAVPVRTRGFLNFCVPRHCISAAPGGWRQGRGAPEHVRGKEGMAWHVQAGRRAGSPAGADERGSGSPHRMPGPRLTDRNWGPQHPAAPVPRAGGGAGGEGGGAVGVCGAERGGEGVERRAGWERAALSEAGGVLSSGYAVYSGVELESATSVCMGLEQQHDSRSNTPPRASTRRAGREFSAGWVAICIAATAAAKCAKP